MLARWWSNTDTIPLLLLPSVTHSHKPHQGSWRQTCLLCQPLHHHRPPTGVHSRRTGGRSPRSPRTPSLPRVEERVLVGVLSEDLTEEGAAGGDDHLVCFDLILITG